MAERKITADYVDYYKRVEFTQPLAHGVWVREIYNSPHNGMWTISYKSNSVHHICPYTGEFVSCDKCMEEYDGPEWDAEGEVEWCLSFETRVSSKVLASRANTCRDAGLEVKFFEE